VKYPQNGEIIADKRRYIKTADAREYIKVAGEILINTKHVIILGDRC